MAERRKKRRSSTRGGDSSSKSGEGHTTRGTAPSAPDIKSLELMEPSEEAKAHEPSSVDAMGQDKRRQVVGHSYGPSKKSQVIFFAAVGAVILLLVGGGLAAVAAFDQPKDDYPDKSPWSAAAAEQIPTRDPSGPCGEPGNPYPFPADSSCATSATSEDQPPPASAQADEGNPGRAPGQEQGSGGVTQSGGEAGSSGDTSQGD